MAAGKTERLMNLLIMLLVQRDNVSKERIREVLYPSSHGEAFEKMFERDKEELRSLGVPIETGVIDSFFEDEIGYRVSPEQFALPPITLEADELAVVALATKVWENASMAEATTEAVRKLNAAGLETDVSALEIVQPRLAAEEGSFDAFVAATQDRQVVEFDYRGSKAAEPSHRRLQPWGVVRYSGRWYAVGHDVDRDDTRIFRLSRVLGEARAVGEFDAFEVPAEVDVRDIARTLAPAPPTGKAVLLLRQGSGYTLRRAADSTESGVTGPDGSDDWDRVVLTRVPADLVGAVLGHGPDAYVEEPADLRREVGTRLEQLVARLDGETR